MPVDSNSILPGLYAQEVQPGKRGLHDELAPAPGEFPSRAWDFEDRVRSL